jgi:hypothetical protein
VRFRVGVPETSRSGIDETRAGLLETGRRETPSGSAPTRAGARFFRRKGAKPGMDPSPEPGWPSFEGCAQALAPLFVAGRERRRRVVDRRQVSRARAAASAKFCKSEPSPSPCNADSAQAWRAAARSVRIQERQPGAPGGRSGTRGSRHKPGAPRATGVAARAAGAAGRAVPWRLDRRAAPRRSPGVRDRAASASVAATDVRQGGPRDRVALAPRFGAERATPEFSRLAGARRPTAPPLAREPSRPRSSTTRARRCRKVDEPVKDEKGLGR